MHRHRNLLQFYEMNEWTESVMATTTTVEAAATMTATTTENSNAISALSTRSEHSHSHTHTKICVSTTKMKERKAQYLRVYIVTAAVAFVAAVVHTNSF